MVSITTRRAGLICVAGTANDRRDVFMAWGLTQRAAERRLCRRMERW